MYHDELDFLGRLLDATTSTRTLRACLEHIQGTLGDQSCAPGVTHLFILCK